MRERNIHDRRRAFLPEVVPVMIADFPVPESVRIDVVSRQDGLDISPVLLRDGGNDLFRRARLFFAVQTGRYEQIHAIRFAVDMFINPVEFDVQ